MQLLPQEEMLLLIQGEWIKSLQQLGVQAVSTTGLHLVDLSLHLLDLDLLFVDLDLILVCIYQRNI